MKQKIKMKIKNLDSKLVVSAAALVMAFFLAGPTSVLNALVNANLAVVLVAIIAGIYASFMEQYRIQMLIRKGAKATVDYVTDTFVGGEMGLMNAVGGVIQLQQVMSPLKAKVTRTLGMTLVLISKLVDIIMKGTAAFLATIILFLSAIRFPVEITFFLGLWVIIVTLLLTVLTKFTGVIHTIMNMFQMSTPVIDFREYSKKSKNLLMAVSGLSFAVWIITGAQWYALLVGFAGYVPGFFTVFLVFALANFFTHTPMTLAGIGVIELAGMGILSVLGMPLAASFLTILIWDLTKFVSNGFFITILLKHEQKKQAAQYQ